MPPRSAPDVARAWPGSVYCPVDAGLHHRVEHQPAAPGSEVDLVAVEGVATALAHDVRVRLEQAQDLVRRRYGLTLQDAALGLVHHAA